MPLETQEPLVYQVLWVLLGLLAQVEELVLQDLQVPLAH